MNEELISAAQGMLDYIRGDDPVEDDSELQDRIVEWELIINQALSY